MQDDRKFRNTIPCRKVALASNDIRLVAGRPLEILQSARICLTSWSHQSAYVSRDCSSDKQRSKLLANLVHLRGLGTMNLSLDPRCERSTLGTIWIFTGCGGISCLVLLWMSAFDAKTISTKGISLLQHLQKLHPNFEVVQLHRNHYPPHLLISINGPLSPFP